MKKIMERIASWSVSEDGIATFRYEIDGRQFMFCVTRATMQEVLRDIGKLAANPTLPLDWNDAAYLTAMIREVMDMLEPIATRDGSIYAMRDMYSLAWTIMMFGCGAVLVAASAVFVLWGI